MLNTQGFLTHKDEIEKLTNEIRPKILCLTETHVHEEVSDVEISIRNYNIVRTNTKNSRTGGVLTYIKKKMNYRIIENVEDDDDGNKQVMWLNVIQVSMGKGEDIIIGNTYHSPSTSDGKFIELIVNQCDRLVDRGHVIILGDINIDMSKKNHYTERLSREMGSLGMKQYVQKPTRCGKESKTVIDLVFSNFFIEVDVLQTPKITDHSIVKVNVNIIDEKEKEDAIIYYKRDYSNFNQEQFRILLDDKLKDNISCNKDVDLLANSTINGIMEAVDEIAPKIKKVLPVKWENKKWIDEEVKGMLRERDGAYKKAAQSKAEKDWKEFKRCRNAIVTKIREKKRNYYERNLDDKRNKSKEMWKTLKELVGTKKMKPEFKSVEFDGVIYTDTKVIADKFNRFFIDSVINIVNEIEKVEKTEIEYERECNSEMNKFQEITAKQLDKIINGLDIRKGGGEGVTTEIIKMTWSTNKNQIINLINKSLQEGKVPESWKNSVITPIPKVIGSNKAENYRPINTLPVYEKILEQVVKDQLLEYIDKNDILIAEQSGFRSGHSCETTIQKILIEWRQRIDKNEKVGVVFIDFKRAFETIDRKELIKKLKMYGIGETVLKWFESYLENRTQQVKFGDILSEKLEIKTGVPQGSILGPLLFILYINDVIKVYRGRKCKFRLFADDKMIYVYSDNIDFIIKTLNEILTTLTEWLNKNSLKINIKKTVYMTICDPRKVNIRANCDVYVGNEPIIEVQDTKYLGILIDKHLTFERHAWYIAKKVGKKIGFLGRLRNVVSSYVKVLIYKTIIAPHYEYCSSIMLNFSQRMMEMLQKTQNRAMRIILNVNRYTAIKSMLEALCFMNVRQRMEYNVCILVYKMRNNIVPKYLSQEIRYVNEKHAYSTRSSTDIAIERTRTLAAHKTLTYHGFQMFNNIPVEIRDITEIKIFKSRLAKYIKEKKR